MAGTDTITSGTQAAGGWYGRLVNGKSRKQWESPYYGNGGV